MRFFGRGADSPLPQIKWIWGFTRGDRLRYVVMTLCDCFGAVCYSLYALICKNLVDSAIARDRTGLISNAVLLLGIILARTAIAQYSAWLGGNMAKRWEMRMRQSAFDSILKKDEKAVNRFHSGALLDRIFADAGKAAGNAVDSLTNLMSMLAGLIAALASLFWLNAVLPLIIVAAGTAFVFLRRLFKNRIKENFLRSRQADGECRSYYQEALENLLILRVFRAGAKALERAKRFDESCYGAWKAARRYNMLLSGGMSAFFSLGGLFSLTACAFLMMWGRLSYGSLTATLQLIAQLQTPFTWAFDQISAFTVMTGAAQRLMELENLPETPASEDIDVMSVYENLKEISFDNVFFGYEGGRRVFEGVTAGLAKGCFAMITGASGIGKSTLLKLLVAVYRPDAGEIRLEMQDGSSVPLDASSRPLFAYVPQGNLLFSGTIRDNLTFLCGPRTDAAINEALRLARADGFVGETAKGLDTVLEEGGRGLSEGQSQRLAIARALLCEAPVLLLDEATSALDADTEREVLENLRGLENRTVLLVSHRKAALAVVDREWRLDNGRLYERDIKR